MSSGRFRNFCTLLDSGSINIDAIDENGRTPLVLACYIPSSTAGSAMVRKLHQHRADLSKKDYTGKTVLHHAVIQHHLPILRYLLDIKGLNLNAQDNEGNTPLHYIVSKQDFKLLKMLIHRMNQFCIRSEVRNKNGFTPLLLACKIGRVDIARYLTRYARQSPMAIDHKTIRNGRTWLETILFIPSELDPFNCQEQDLFTIFPKPIDYIPKDCIENAISYNWHFVVFGGVKTGNGLQRPRTAQPLFRTALSPKTTASFSSTTSLKSSRSVSSRAFYYRSASYASSDHTTSNGNRELPTTLSVHTPRANPHHTLPGVSCLELLPRFLSLKASSEGLLPAAFEPLEEEKTPSELDALEEDRVDSQTPNKMARQTSNSELKSNSKKFRSGEKSKQKLENVAATTNSISKIASGKRRKSTIPS